MTIRAAFTEAVVASLTSKSKEGISMKRAALAVSLLVLFSSSLFAQRKDPVFLRDAIDARSYPAAPRLAEHAMTVAATSLPAAEASVPEEIVAIREWNEAGRVPARNGFTRALPDV